MRPTRFPRLPAWQAEVRRGLVAGLMALFLLPSVQAQTPAQAPATNAGAASAAATSSPSGTQGRWKWRDASGRINVSDLPPPREIPEKDILERRLPAGRDAGAGGRTPGGAPVAPAGASAPSPAPARAGNDTDLERRRRAEQAREAAARTPQDDPQLAARRRDNCSRARAQLAALDSGQRMARVNEKGERIVMDDRARAEEARRAREIIASDCS